VRLPIPPLSRWLKKLYITKI